MCDAAVVAAVRIVAEFKQSQMHVGAGYRRGAVRRGKIKCGDWRGIKLKEPFKGQLLRITPTAKRNSYRVARLVGRLPRVADYARNPGLGKRNSVRVAAA